MWSAVVIGTHPVESDQQVWLALAADDVNLGTLPAFWIENKGGNSFWHVPIPPQSVGARLHYRAIVRRANGEIAECGFHDTIVRPNLPDRKDATDLTSVSPEGLAGNRMMSVRVDSLGSTYDIYFPTVGLHSNVRPQEGDLLQSRSHFRSIVGGLAVGRRLDWFPERAAWEQFQHYLGATNILTTEMQWRKGPIRVLITDFAVMGDELPQNAGREQSPGQYIKRFRITNDGDQTRRALFGVHVQAEVNGGVGDPGLSWHDGDRTLLAINRGHAHSNRKLARDATIEFALALDDRGEVHCEPTGPNEAMLLRWIELPAGDSLTVDLLVSGAFTGWSGDLGTFEHWLRPALHWFRTTNLDLVEQATALEWDNFVEPLPNLHVPKAAYAVSLRRSALAASLHVDAEEGSVASGLDRGLNAYCWPREAIWIGRAFDRIGHPSIGRGVFQWLNKVRTRHQPFLYWFQKYSMDGVPEWETPSIDQTAMIPWGVEGHYRRTGDLSFVSTLWPMIEQAARVCQGDSGGHPGLTFLDDLSLITSAGLGEQFYGAYLYSNACVVAGLRAAARLAAAQALEDSSRQWSAFADRIWNTGILTEADESGGPGLVHRESGRFLVARRLSKLRGQWTSQPAFQTDQPLTLDVNMLGLAMPLGLLPASDPRLVRTAEGILRINASLSGDPNLLIAMAFDPKPASPPHATNDIPDIATLATLWMARYLIQLGHETGQGRHWTRAVSMLEAILARLSPLGLVLKPSGRWGETGRLVGNSGGMVWRLHTMLIETMLDLGGLDYDAVARTVHLRPTLPATWPHTGISQTFPCGEISYRLERPIGGTVHRLSVRSNLKQTIELKIRSTCPGLVELGPWQANPEGPPPVFDPRTGSLSWSIRLPVGESDLSWTWG
jgi:hypothetical protein